MSCASARLLPLDRGLLAGGGQLGGGPHRVVRLRGNSHAASKSVSRGASAPVPPPDPPLIDFADLLGRECGVRQDTRMEPRKSASRHPWHSPRRAGDAERRHRAGLGHAYGDLRTLAGNRPRGAGARGRSAWWPFRLRQVDPAGADLRPARARVPGRSRSGAERPRSASPAAPTCPSATCSSPGTRRSTTRRWRCATAASAAARRGAQAAALFERFGLGGFERPAPGRALGRDAPARRLPAHPDRRQAGAGARRAVRLARRDHPRGDAGVAGRGAAARPAHRRPRHP